MCDTVSNEGFMHVLTVCVRHSTIQCKDLSPRHFTSPESALLPSSSAVSTPSPCSLALLKPILLLNSSDLTLGMSGSATPATPWSGSLSHSLVGPCYLPLHLCNSFLPLPQCLSIQGTLIVPLSSQLEVPCCHPVPTSSI